MKIKDLQLVIFDNVRIYESVDIDSYKELYTGNLLAAPENLIEREVLVIGAVAKGTIDIQVIKN